MSPVPRAPLIAVTRAIASVCLVIAGWWALVELFNVSTFVVPSPWEAATAVRENAADIIPLAGDTLGETAAGFAAGAIVGFLFAVLFAQAPLVRSLLYPALIAGQAVPIVAIAAPLVIVLGFGLLPKVVIVAWIVFFPVTVSVLDGLTGVDRDLLNLARVMGGSRWRVFTHITLPASVMPLFSGLKIGATYAVTGAVIGELVASQGESLAGYQRAANGFLDTPLVYGITLVMTAIGVGWFLAVVALERLATPWRTRSTSRTWRRSGRHN